jgi:DNA-binding NarL/FixJ family response regulator
LRLRVTTVLASVPLRGDNMKRVRVLLADDHRMVTEGIKGLLADEFELVGVVADGHAMVAETKKLRPDVVVADISMPHLNGIDALAVLKKDNPETKVVFLTMHQNAAYARRALEAGASGYVLKHSASVELVLAIHAALKGETFITPALAAEVQKDAQHRPRDTNEARTSDVPRC